MNSPPLQILCFTSRELCGICLKLLVRDYASDASVTVTHRVEETLEMISSQDSAFDVVVFAAICGESLARVRIADLSRMIGKLPLIVHVDAGTQAEVDSLIAQGARGVIPTSSSAAVAVAAIRLVAEGGIYVPMIAARAMAKFVAPDTSASGVLPEVPKLTAREREVLRLVGMGMNNLAIADKLGIAEATVKVHIGRLRKRLRVTDRAQMVLTALRLRAIQTPLGGGAAADL